MTDRKKLQHATIDTDWLEGVVAAAEYAHDQYADTNCEDIIDAVIAAKVREEAGL